jgi:hypothetical protein
VNASHVKVENVVKPPMSPTAIGVMTDTGKCPRATARKKASRNAPERLIPIVAHGNRD